MERIVNPEAPRPYFPDPRELDRLPLNHSLPDLFEFLDPERGRVEKPEDWEARRQELMDALKYYLYGSRLDPRKEDTAVTAVRENYRYDWAEGVMPGKPGWFGYDAPPRLPEGSCRMRVMDLSAFGGGKVYADIAPAEDYVHTGPDYPLPGGLRPWRAGEGWSDHGELVKKVKLPAVTVEISIRDTNPQNAAWVSPAAKTGVSHSFQLRFPAETPVVEGRSRGPRDSRDGRGWPVLVCLGGLSEEQIVTLNANGYVYLSVNDATDPDRGELAKYEQLYPPRDPVVRKEAPFQSPYPVDSGNLMHSGWMASRALDALENYQKLSRAEKKALNPRVILPEVDVCAAAVTGCSNNGKRAIVAGVFDTGAGGDTRFDIIAPSDSGGGGASGFRYATEGQLFSYEPPVQNGFGGGVTVHDFAYGFNETTQRAIQNTGEDQWFCDRAQVFTLRPELAEHVPIDAHALLAAFASAKEERYFLTWTGEGQDAWLNSPATVLNTWAAREVYEFLGKGDAAVVVRDQAHANQDRDLPDLIALMDRVFYGEKKLLRRYHASLAGPGGLLAADGSGAILPEKEFASLHEMERNPYFIPSVYLSWSRPDKHRLWTEANSVTSGVPVCLRFHTDAARVTLRLPDGAELSAPVSEGLAVLRLTAAQAMPGCYLATAEGEKAPKSIELRGWTLGDALRHSVTDNSALGHDVGSGIAFTTPVVNYADPADPPRLYLNGEELPADTFDYDNRVTLPNGRIVPQSGYLQPYGATVTLYEGTAGAALPMGEKAVFSLRNVKLEALQGFTVNLDAELEKFDPNEGRGGKKRQRFRTTYRTLSTQTPVWVPELRQLTPRLGLPAGEERWPLLGNWASDFDEHGALRPLEEIRPLRSKTGPGEYKGAPRLLFGGREGFTLSFAQAVNPHELGLALDTVPGFRWTWAEDRRSLRVDYDAPADKAVTAFLFRSVDGEGNMIGGPAAFTVPAE